MNAYADSGFLCSLYAPDAHTQRAVARMARQSLPLPFVWLHQLELRNALRLRVFRAEITPAQRDASLNAMLADRSGGMLAVVAPPLAEVMIEAERLSALHSEILGTRCRARRQPACFMETRRPSRAFEGRTRRGRRVSNTQPVPWSHSPCETSGTESR